MAHRLTERDYRSSMGIGAPRSRRPRTPRPHSSLAPGVLVLVLCALVAATFDGPRWSTAHPGDDRPVATQQHHRGDRADESAEQAQQEQGDDQWVPWAPPVDLLLLVPAALVLGTALVVLARLRLVRRRRQLTGRSGARRAPVPGTESPPEEEEVGLPEALDASARVLGEGSPRNAIVAAWVLLEQAVESERFHHRPEETPSELVERVVSSYHLDADAISRLAALYREARFSTHAVTEEHRAEAADCLRRLLTSLRAGAR